MSIKKQGILFFIILLLSSTIFAFLNYKDSINKHKVIQVKKVIKEKPKVKVITISEKQENTLTNWVYRHSNHCSLYTARKIVRLSSDYNHRLWILALMATESHFDTHAYSRTGAIGLGQIMPLWVKELKENNILQRKTDLWNATLNINATKYILDRYLEKANGDFKASLTFYFGRKSRNYVNKVYLNLGSLVVALNIN